MSAIVVIEGVVAAFTFPQLVKGAGSILFFLFPSVALLVLQLSTAVFAYRVQVSADLYEPLLSEDVSF